MKLPRLRKPPAAPGPKVVPGVTRAGTVGVGIFHNGRMTGWGADETAAWASHQFSMFAKSARIVAVRADQLRPRIRR